MPQPKRPPAIRITGARQHNLKNLSLEIPLQALTVITGPSGSGKSSLAFHTLYAEGQRRYVETFSPYVRQFFDRMDKPEVDRIDGIPPAIAIEQKNTIRTTRSTVGTLTEINDFLKLLYPRLATAFHPLTGKIIRPDTPNSILQATLDRFPDQTVLVLFPLPLPSNTSTADFFPFLNSQGYLRILLDGQVVRTDEASPPKKLPSEVLIIQDRIKVTPRNKSRLIEAFEAALKLGNGFASVTDLESDTLNFSTSWAPLRPPTPSLFSFNSPLGACQNCRGFGRVIGLDLTRAIPDPRLSLAQGAIKPFQSDRGLDCQRDLLRLCREVGIDPKSPFRDLTPEQKRWVKYGERPRSSGTSSLEQTESLWQEGRWYGVQGFFDWLESKSYKMHVRVFLSRYRAYTECPECQGQRLQPDALHFQIDHKTLPDLWHLPLEDLATWTEKISQLPAAQEKTTQIILTEITSRLYYLNEVGLGYLTLDRPARTLSGGEIARVNLTTCLGSALTQTLFVLDEPTVGLHHRDISRLVKVMHRLRDKGNTLVVVEHDEAVMTEADHLLDLGPLAGEGGGEIVATLTQKNLTQKSAATQFPHSVTLPYLQGKKTIPTPERNRSPKATLAIRNASANNIQDLNLDLPLGVFVCLTGVSGSGKSTLAHPIIYHNLARHFGLPLEEDPAPAELHGMNELRGVELIDQSPLARTPRSTPAVLLGAFEHLRQLLAATPEARAAELTPGYFSFNSGPGRCQRCAGNGFEKVEMQFLSDLYLTCPDCQGSRFTKEAQEFTYAGHSVVDYLQMTAAHAATFFETLTPESNRERLLLSKIRLALHPLIETGLGYLRLGQPLNTLSGGEAQRLKLCQLLASTSGSVNTLLILDEPTTGLHFTDIERLLQVFHRLVDLGFSLLVIEHQTDVIKNADHVIEIGPEAGLHGGTIVFEGSPAELAKGKTHTAHAVAARNPKTRTKAAPKNLPSPPKNQIEITGLRHHNLKNLSLTIPHHEFVVVSGLSGSGKSTLAFDVIFAEGQRRFLDSMSPYARQFASQLEKPDLDLITGLPPTVAIEQRISRGGGKSTVGTVTEIYHFLRLLFAKVGLQHCPQSGEPVVSQTPEKIGQKLSALLKKHPSLRLLAPVLRGRKGFHKEFAATAQQHGFPEMFIDGKLIRTDDFRPLARHQTHDIDFVVGQLTSKSSKKEVAELLTIALSFGKGTFRVLTTKGKLEAFSTARVSPTTGESFEELDPYHFSFNSSRGWCPTCRGYGFLHQSFIKNQSFNSVAEAEIYEEKQAAQEDSETRQICPDCHGARLKESSRHVLVNDTSLPDLAALSVIEAHAKISKLKFTGRDREITRDILPEISQRLAFLEKVGLGYLQLDRSALTLSGGESQRIRLAAQLGSNLQGVLYILDEPTIGLHPRDNAALLSTLQALKEKGNSLLLVEHDEDTIKAATHLIDLGPGAGVEGGHIVFSGKPTTKGNHPNSPTLTALKNPLTHPSRTTRRPIPAPKSRNGWLRLTGCHLNNLKNLSVQIPLARLTVLTGVSGSGKSSLMRGCLTAAATHEGPPDPSLPFTKATGFETLRYCYEVDQSPIGKTSRSCPATYVKLFDHIRELFAQLPESRIRGYSASRFSFNNKEGQCPECKGNGRIKLEMDFLPTTWIDCENCYGQRYNPATLEVRYQGHHIGEVLQMNITRAAEFFAAQPKLQQTLQLLTETGLGYLTLGQPSPTLSGGEAQRLKLVTQLTRGRPKISKLGPTNTNLYLIEEPTIGLHQQDVARLTDVLHRLVDEGHTVVVIEHHMDLAAEADYLLDLGPEAGPNGGQIVAQGTPEQVANSPHSLTAPFLNLALKP